MAGFIAITRDSLDHHLLQDAERFRAWIWLIANAAWKPTKTRIKGETVDIGRGELTFSQRFLAEKWGWSKSRVDRFIADLRAESMIETRSKNGASAGHQAGQGQSIISICNYDKYQFITDDAWGNDGARNGASAGQARGKEEQGNKGTIELEPKGSCASDDAHALKPEHFVEAWNNLADRLGKPKIRKLTPERRVALKARINGYTVEEFREVLGNIETSPFLRGDRGWTGCTFDWITKKANFQKILEGNYNG